MGLIMKLIYIDCKVNALGKWIAIENKYLSDIGIKKKYFIERYYNA